MKRSQNRNAAILTVVAVLTLGCSTRGTAHRTAEALDVTTFTPTEARGSSSTPNASTRPVGALERLRYRLTTTQTQPPTARQRAAAIVGTAGGIALVAVIALAILAPGVLAGFALRTAARFRRAFRQTVAGVQEARNANAAGAVTEYLARAQDAKTKVLVETVKREP